MNPKKVMKLVQLWAHNNPFMFALIVLVAVVAPGFARQEQITNKVEAEAQRNADVISCLVQQADGIDSADVINKTSIAAAYEVWTKVVEMINNPSPTTQKAVKKAIRRYQAILGELIEVAAINPSADIVKCLELKGIDVNRSIGVQFNLMSYKEVGRPGKWDDTCFGRTVTIRGTFGDDVIRATDGNDVIFSYSGDDTILGGKGNDRICSRAGDDLINSGQDYDAVDCGKGNDFALQTETVRNCE